MQVTMDISLYPLDRDYKTPIKDFIRDMRLHDDVEILTNQMSTQVRGDFDAVMTAINACMKRTMAQDAKVVFVSKCINAGLDIDRAPGIEPESG